MKQIIFLLCFFSTFHSTGQEIRIDPHHINQNDELLDPDIEEYNLSNDTNIDINFYHLHLDIGIDTKYLKGQVDFLVTSKIDDLYTMQLDLSDAFSIDSIIGNIESFQFENRIITIQFKDAYTQNQQFSFTIYYQGIPALVNNTKGLRYEKHDGGEPIIVSLSTPFLAHSWWPCKDGTSDKSDSTHIDITIKDTTINEIPLIAIANGILSETIIKDGFKTFKWKHNYPSVPYYNMVAISNYKIIEQTYNGFFN